MLTQVAYGHGEDRYALSANSGTELAIALQPIFEANQTKPVGFYEALLRLPTSSDPFFHAHLVRIAEAMGFINRIDLCVLKEAIATLYRYANISIAVNISPMSIRDAGAQILVELAESQLQERLIFELTETTKISTSEISAFAEGIHQLGSLVAIDDFETGFADEELVLAVKPDFIKVVFEDTSASVQARISRAVELAKHLGAEVVAEKIDSQTKIDRARALGVHYLQGFALGRPFLPDGMSLNKVILAEATVSLDESLATGIRHHFAHALQTFNCNADIGLKKKAGS